MDAEAAALLTTAGTTVAALMATDAWKQTRDGLVRIWHRFRPEQAEAIGRELTASRAVVASALARGDAQPEAPLGRLWAQELRELLADPHAARDLRALLLACKQAAPGNDRSPSRSQRAEARPEGHNRSYAAGHDMTVIEGQVATRWSTEDCTFTRSPATGTMVSRTRSYSRWITAGSART